jgi:hypothetical protein
MVRGCEYVLNGRIVEEPYELTVYFVHEHNVPDLLSWALNSRSAQKVALGPGFHVVRAAVHDEPNTVLYKITIWGTLVVYAVD